MPLLERYQETCIILIIFFLFCRCDVIVLTNDTKANILDKVKGVDAIFWNTHCMLDKEILDAAGKTSYYLNFNSSAYLHGLL